MLGFTVIATVYFGWHYIIDDFAGLFIGVVAVWGAERMTTRLRQLARAEAASSYQGRCQVVAERHREQQRIDSVEHAAVRA